MLKQVGSVAFQLQLPHHTRIHPVFHVSQLKGVGDHFVEPTIPNELTYEDERCLLEHVLDHQTVDKHGVDPVAQSVS